ncbi:hypothetical protein [Corynebacterium glyciniphilum]|uniref:hypothetical protein n=1 Tax=Corynebacterium glyciniphilum TaxID=1404244 RepID=UPI003DA1B17E
MLSVVTATVETQQPQDTPKFHGESIFDRLVLPALDHEHEVSRRFIAGNATMDEMDQAELALARAIDNWKMDLGVSERSLRWVRARQGA